MPAVDSPISDPSEKTPWRLLLTLAGVGLVARIIAIWCVGANGLAFGDARDYVFHAQVLCATHAYPDRGLLPLFRPPGLPFLIAAGTLCHPTAVPVIKLWLAAIDLCNILAVFLLARVTVADARVASLAACLAALYPAFVLQVTEVSTETPFMLLLTLSLTSILRARSEHTHRVTAGVTLGLAALFRPTALAVLPLGAAACILDGASSPRARLKRLAFLLLGIVLTVGPWTLRNALRYGELIAVSDGGAPNLWWGSVPGLADLGLGGTREQLLATEQRLDAEFLRQGDVIARSAATPAARGRMWRSLAMDNIRRSPGRYVGYCLAKAWHYWRPWLDPRLHPRWEVLGSALFMGPLIAFGLCGLWTVGRTDRFTAVFWLAFFITGCVVHVPFHLVVRYRIPFTDPALLVFASALLVPMVLGVGASPQPRHGRV